MTLEERIIEFHHKKIVDDMFEHRLKVYKWSDRKHIQTPIADLETSHIKNILKAISSNYENEGLWGQNYKKKYLENELTLRMLEER